MTKSKHIFNSKPIRAEYIAERKEWLFSASDVCNVLADSQSGDPSAYWRNLKKRLTLQGVQLVSNCYELKMPAANGKLYPTDALNAKSLIELTRYIKSPHTDAFLRWLSEFDGTSKKYVLKHKDISVVEIELGGDGAISIIGKMINEAHLPVGTVDSKGIDTKGLKDWWSSRSIPASRENLKEVLNAHGMSVPQQLLDKSFGLSLSDQYWICPQNAHLKWADINFFHNDFSEDVGNLLFGKTNTKDAQAVSFLSPDNTSDGMLKKKWKIINGKRCLIKGGTGPMKQEIANEVIAARICERLGIPFVSYEIKEVEGDKYSVCEDFITGDTELIPAWRIDALAKKSNNVSKYERFVKMAESFGVADVRKRIDMMITLDFIIVNTDRHYNNFGLVRNADTLEWLSVAPIFDSGTSMWSGEFTEQINPTSLQLKCKPFNEKHNEQIRHVKDFSWLDLSKLSGIEAEYTEILSSIVDNRPEFDTRIKKLGIALRKRIEILKAIIEKRQTN